MTARTRKFFGLIGILVFMTAYVAVVATIGGLLPENWAIQLAFYGVAGIVWGVPLFPLISWMNRGR